MEIYIFFSSEEQWTMASVLEKAILDVVRRGLHTETAQQTSQLNSVHVNCKFCKIQAKYMQTRTPRKLRTPIEYKDTLSYEDSTCVLEMVD